LRPIINIFNVTCCIVTQLVKERQIFLPKLQRLALLFSLTTSYKLNIASHNWGL